jgi:type III secretion protein J
VQFFQRTPSEVPATAARTGAIAGGMRGDVASLLLIGLAALAVLLAGLLLWRNRGALLGRPSRGVMRREVSGER